MRAHRIYSAVMYAVLALFVVALCVLAGCRECERYETRIVRIPGRATCVALGSGCSCLATYHEPYDYERQVCVQYAPEPPE